MASTPRLSITTQSLWDKAINSLDADLRDGLVATKTHKRNILEFQEAVLKEVEAQRAVSERKKWKFKSPNGDTVIVRHVLEKIAGWIKTFESVGDVAASFDPVHAALPWAAFRFLLRTFVSDIEVFGALLSDLEIIAQIITRYREFEGLYLQGNKSEVELMMENTLTRLYAEILTHLGRALGYALGIFARFMKSPFRVANPEQMRKIQAHDDEALKLAKLLDTGTLHIIKNIIVKQSQDAIALATDLISEEKLNNILNWLSPLPYRKHHGFVSDSRPTGAGQWLLAHERFIDWQTSSSPAMLLLHGITGSGKSTLCSLVVDSWMSNLGNGPLSCASLAYFYCADPEFDNEHRSSDDVMRTILTQLALAREKPREVKGCVVSLRTRTCAQLILELAEQQTLAIIIDGVDSLEDSERHVLLSALKGIVSKANNVVKIFITSRTNDRTIAAASPNKEIRIISDHTDRDMKIFVNHMVNTVTANSLLLGGNVSPNLRELMVQTLVDGAGEMFLWAKLQVDRLCRENHEDDVAGAKSREVAIRTISWILYMRETLTPTALLEALSVTEGTSPLQLAQVTTICADLVVLDTKHDTACFMHQSVREFLVKQEPFTAAAAHSLIASACVETATCGLPSEKTLGSASNDFGVYAAMYWPVHTKLAEDTNASNPILDKVTAFIFDEDSDTTLSFDLWLQNIQTIGSSLARDHAMKPNLQAIPNGDAGFLFLISVFGLDCLLGLAFSNLDDIALDEPNDFGTTPVYLAAALGHAKVVSMLAENGASIDILCGRHGSALHAACFNGHLEVVKTLLSLGVDIVSGGVYDNALQAAFQGGQERVALHLIDHGGVITREDNLEKALEGAARSGLFKTVELLQDARFVSLSKGQSKPDKLSKKIRKAIEGGELNVLRQFLGRQAHIKDVLPLDSVSLATLYNHPDMVDFILDHGVSVEAKGPFGTPLRTAALLNSESLVRLLLSRGADINAYEPFGDALQVAALKGHTSILKLLIDEGAYVNQQCGFYGTALQAAAYHGREKAVEIILDAGAHVYAEGYSKDAFYAAAEGGHQDVIMTMLRRGYDFHSSFEYSRVYHRLAAISLGELLLRIASTENPKQRATPGEKIWDRERRSTTLGFPINELGELFCIAGDDCKKSYPQVSKTSVSVRRSPRRALGDSVHPLWTAASAGHEETVKLLLGQKERLHIEGTELRDAIRAAASNGHMSVIQTILDDVVQREPLISYINVVREEGRRAKQPQVTAFALAVADEHCPAEEVREWRRIYTAAAGKPNEPVGLHEQLIATFREACKIPDRTLIRAILDSEDQEELPQEEIDAGLQSCVLHGKRSLVQIFIDSPVLKRLTEFSLEEAFVAAAAGGFKDMMELFQSHMTNTTNRPNDDTILRSFALSSENGHIQVVRYLAENYAVDFNIPATDTCVAPSLSKILEDTQGSQSQINADDVTFHRPFRRGRPKSHVQNVEGIDAGVISPLQAVLRGFARFNSWGRFCLGPLPRSVRNGHWRQAEQLEQQEVLKFLLHLGLHPNELGGQDHYPIQVAANWCPISVVEELISAGADVNLCQKGETALFAAAGRELAGGPIVEKLLLAGATIPKGTTFEKILLNQSFHFFEEDHYHLKTSPRDWPSLRRWCQILQMTAVLGHSLFADLLLSRGTDVNAVGYHFGTALEAASHFGHTTMVQYLLDAGAQVNAVEGHWGTPLRAALAGGHETVTRILLSHGADIRIPTAEQWKDLYLSDRTPIFHLGVRSDNLEIVKMLLKAGADAVRGTPGALHPLILASKLGKSEIVKALLDAGASPNVTWPEDNPGDDSKNDSDDGSDDISDDGSRHRSEHDYIPSHNLNDLPVRDLRAGSVWGYTSDAHESSPIHAAVSHGYLDVVKLLVARGADIEQHIERRPKPLLVAAARGYVDIVRFLLSSGAKVDDSKALFEAVMNGDTEIAKDLLTAGANASSVVNLACRMRNCDILELLVERVYDTEEKPETVIDNAFSTRGISDSSFRVLMEYSRPTKRGFSRICAEGLVTLAEVLLAEGFEVNQPDENDDFPLQIAAASLQPEIISLLLSHGAQVDCHKSERGTPLELALEACAEPMLRNIKSEIAKNRLDGLSRPLTTGMYRNDSHTLPGYYNRSTPSTRQRVLRCEEIVQLLVASGARICNNGRPFGPPFHLASFLGSKAMVQLLIDDGEDTDEDGGFFKKAIFAAIQGVDPRIVALLLEKDPRTNQMHSHYGSPLHLACAIGDSTCVEKLLEHGADPTLLDSEERTPLTIALRYYKEYYRDISTDKETTIDALRKRAKCLRVCDDDLVYAAEIGEEFITILLDLDKEMVVSEQVMCRVLGVWKGYREGRGMLELLMQRTGGLDITSGMLKACRNDRVREALLKHNVPDDEESRPRMPRPWS
ncbi:hypothetical protein PG989_016314 [Apiospora arundinis]